MMPPLAKSSSVPGLMKLGTGLTGSYKGTNGNYKGVDVVDIDDKERLAELLKTGFPPRYASGGAPAARPQGRSPKNAIDLSNSPAWLKHDKQVLRFYGFFQESVSERNDENSRFRQVEVMYFMEDGTLKVIEPRVENSGIPQGYFLKRHRCPRDDNMGFVGPDDLKVGCDITLYKRTYHLSGCDRFTRWFYEENGVPLAEDEPLIEDTYQSSYKFKKVAEKGGLPLSRSAFEAKKLTKVQAGQVIADRKEVQFLLNDRKVLRFKAYWDDHTLYGARIYFIVHYYLADNTVEINEAHSRNSGRDNYPTFMRRGPLYKATDHTVSVPGMMAADPVPYVPEDFLVGGSINVWRRDIVIYDCDDFTRTFYKDFLGIDQSESKIDVSERPVNHRKLHPPPHNGIGREEDSIENVIRIQPKIPKADLVRLMTLSGEVVRFEAKLVNGEPEDADRRFIIAFYPADDMLAIFELQSRNSGHMGGKWSDKRRQLNPATGRYFDLGQLLIGTTVVISSAPFKILRADEHCLKYLEDRPGEFPFADPVACALKLEPLKDEPQMQSESGIDPDALLELASKHGISLVDHEVVTLLRAFDIGEEEPNIAGPAILEVLRSSGS